MSFETMETMFQRLPPLSRSGQYCTMLLDKLYGFRVCTNWNVGQENKNGCRVCIAPIGMWSGSRETCMYRSCMEKCCGGPCGMC